MPDAAALVALEDRRGELKPRQEWAATWLAPTITANGMSDRGRKRLRVELAEESPRQMTARDAAALQTFPPDFRVPERATEGQAWALYGEAVPPRLAEAWARSVARVLRA